MGDRDIVFEAGSIEAGSKKRGSAFDELLTRLGNYEIGRWGYNDSANYCITMIGDLKVQLFSETIYVNNNKDFSAQYSSEEVKNLYKNVKDNLRAKNREESEERLWEALDKASKSV